MNIWVHFNLYMTQELSVSLRQLLIIDSLDPANLALHGSSLSGLIMALSSWSRI